MKIIITQSKSKVKKGKSKIQNHDNLEEEEKLDFINPFSGHFTNVIKIGGRFFLFDDERVLPLFIFEDCP